MNDMPPKHATPAAPEPKRRDHLWVLIIIGACALLEVWGSWLGIGAVSGFPKFGRMTTGWILPVTTEAYWGYALFAWLAGAPGPRSRRFAMATAVIMFCLSLAGQECGHLIAAANQKAPEAMVGFVTALPLIAVGLIAILIHLRQADREEAAAAARAAAEAARLAREERIATDERTALRRQLATERQARDTELCGLGDELRAERTARTDAQQEAARLAGAEARLEQAQATAETEQEARQAAETALADIQKKLEAAEAKAARLARKLEPNAPNGTRTSAAKNRTTVPNDVAARAEALRVLDENPGITGKELGELCGMGERWGQLRKKEYTAHVTEDADATEGRTE